ncbi:DUF1707 SHOCT-like domain-containing protein [Micromonosporaceae bacterium Da 78-11]
MAREVTGPGRRSAAMESMRAADTDRDKIAERLRAALDEGRLSLAEFDDRLRSAYAARTYADLRVLIADLPRPGMTAGEVQARRDAEARRRARRLPLALLVLWTIWAGVVTVNLVVWVLVSISVAGPVYPWPAWLLVPGAALGAATVGIQVIRHQQRAD